jgi:hypothetical protein
MFARLEASVNKALKWMWLLTALCVANIVSATVIQKLSLNVMTRQSDLIGVGQISALRTIVDRGDVWTVATISIEKTVKGAPGQVVYFRLPGGRYTENGRTLVTTVEGVPELTVLQKGVFFLEGKAPQYLIPVGFSQGIWKIDVRKGVETATALNTSPDKSVPLKKFLEEICKTIREQQK